MHGRRLSSATSCAAQMLFYRDRVVGPALHGRVVGDDDALSTADATDSRDDPGGRCVVVVHAVGRERGKLEERRARIDQAVDPVARQELAPRDVTGTCLLRAAKPGAPQCLVQFSDDRGVCLLVCTEGVGTRRRGDRQDRELGSRLHLRRTSLAVVHGHGHPVSLTIVNDTGYDSGYQRLRRGER